MSNKDPLKGYITQKGLPHCIESEEAIASILINNNTVMEVLTEYGIGAEHFHNTFLKDVYSTCSSVIDDGKDIDPLVIINILRKKYDEQVIRKNVFELAEANIFTEADGTHINTLIEYKRKRDDILEACNRIQRAYTDNLHYKVTSTKTNDLTAKELMQMEFPETNWIIPDIITDGLTLLCGRPKIGKSIFAVNLAVAVSLGGRALGQIEVDKRGVLYCGLEDSKRRLQTRISKSLHGVEAPDNLYLKTELPKISDGALQQIEVTLKRYSDIGLVVIDTLGRIKSKHNADIYQQDYDSMNLIKELADKNEIGVIVVHHTRKAQSEDVLDTVLGTTGVTGGADSILVLSKERCKSDAVLCVSGRDIEEKELALKFDPITLSWILQGDASEYRMTPERAEVLNVLRNTGNAMSSSEISAKLGKSQSNVSNMLKKLAEKGHVYQPSYGVYSINTSESNESSETVKVATV